jgi:hypothetical protein
MSPRRLTFPIVGKLHRVRARAAASRISALVRDDFGIRALKPCHRAQVRGNFIAKRLAGRSAFGFGCHHHIGRALPWRDETQPSELGMMRASDNFCRPNWPIGPMPRSTAVLDQIQGVIARTDATTYLDLRRRLLLANLASIILSESF